MPQVFPIDSLSQRLVDAAHAGDLRLAADCLSDPLVDVNFAGGVWLRGRRTEVILREEEADEVSVEYEEIRTEASPLFLAAHVGCRDLVRKLLNSGADINQKLFRGYATTAAVREGRTEILELLVRSGASQPACEEALLEASCHGRRKLVELLMGSDLIRHHIAAQALVSACTRGFVDVVDTLIKHGVDPNTTNRVLLRSFKPPLHTNVDCTALIAAVVSRQAPVVRLLLQAGAKPDAKVSLGAWLWDPTTGEELRVGVGLSEPYPAVWCAVEYFESTGTILRLLLQHHPVNAVHGGRTLLHHAILCANPKPMPTLLSCGADIELPVKTAQNVSQRPIHLAVKLGAASVLQVLVNSGCELDSRTNSAQTAVMICPRYKRSECLKLLVSAGADVGLLDSSGSSAIDIAASNQWTSTFQQSLLEVIRSGKTIKSSNSFVFSSLVFAASCGDTVALQALLAQRGVYLDERDKDGNTPLMAATRAGHVNAFRLLVFAGADVMISNKFGETAVSISQVSQKKDVFEKIMLEHALEKGMVGGFYALHCAARRGDLAAAQLLTTRGHDVNVLDEDDYTPLMLAAREGHGELCALLISNGARCDVKTSRGETALSLARASSAGRSNAEQVILDELSRVLVVMGAHVKKHTKGGKGSPHGKVLRMVRGTGLLRWGRSSRRNVMCQEAEAGPSPGFQLYRRKKGDADEAGVFRVVTGKGREIHFVCEGGVEMAEMWVRGITLLTREALEK